MGIVEDAELGHRHPGLVSLVRYFDHAHLPPHLAAVSAPFGDLVVKVVTQLPDSAELTTAVRKLLEAKDCAVRAAVDAQRGLTL